MAPLGTSALFHVAGSQLPSWGWTCTIASLMGQSCSRLAGSTGYLAICSQGEEAEMARLLMGGRRTGLELLRTSLLFGANRRASAFADGARAERTSWCSCLVTHITRDIRTEMWAHNPQVCMQLCKSSWGVVDRLHRLKPYTPHSCVCGGRVVFCFVRHLSILEFIELKGTL